jgi:hypothetical protein
VSAPAVTLRWLNVEVLPHARARARQRFPDFKTARIVDEVRAAIHGGRVSSSKPVGIAPPDEPNTLYAWTDDGERVYALRTTDRSFFVYTTMRAGSAREER